MIRSKSPLHAVLPAGMNLHEYQSKALLSRYSIAVAQGLPADSAELAREHALALGRGPFMVKAQVHAGGRGKAGGIRKAENPDEVRAIAGEMLGSRLVSAQTGAGGQPINTVLVECASAVERELYLSMLVDRSRAQVAIIASAAGGMDIEEVAASEPGSIVTELVDPAAGLQPYQARRFAFALGLGKEQRREFATLLFAAYRLFVEKDLSLLELNPLATTAEGRLLALDAKINVDDNALFRHRDLAEQRDASQEDEKETRARRFDLSYIALDGNIACMVNGAGLAMGTMDIIELNGGRPANFLDVGGGTDAAKVAEAFRLIVSDSRVEAILVNIFGGIVRCDLIAEGIIQAVGEAGVDIPVVVRLEGTNVEQGRKLLAESGLDIIPARSLGDAAAKAVGAAAAASGAR